MSLIYFPSFEPISENFLKYALLTKEKIRPIAPNQRWTNNGFSKIYKSVLQETDLIEPLEPKLYETELASTNAIKTINQILINPYGYDLILKTHNVLETFRNKENWNFLIYREKFTVHFSNFLIEQKMGELVKNGIKTSETLAFIYMKCLADHLAFNYETSIITDREKFSLFLNLDRNTNLRYLDKVKFVDSLFIPSNLSDLSFNEIIAFRKINSEYIHHYQSAINKFLIEMNTPIPNNEMQLKAEVIRFLDGLKSEYNRKIFELASKCIEVPITCFLSLDPTNKILLKFLMPAIKSMGILIDLKKTNQYETKKKSLSPRKALKYTTNLNNLM